MVYHVIIFHEVIPSKFCSFSYYYYYYYYCAANIPKAPRLHWPCDMYGIGAV